jgi:hypothetical protein
MCVVSSVVHNGLYINTLLSLQRNVGVGDSWRAWGGGWLGFCGQYGTLMKVLGAQRQGAVKPPRYAFLARITHFMLECAIWAFSMVIAAWGRVNVCPCPPPPRRIARRLPKTVAANTGQGPRNTLSPPCPHPQHSIR